MSTASKTPTIISSRYASALMGLAEETKKVEKIESDLLSLQRMLSESEDLRLVVQNPSLGKKDQTNAVEAVSQKAGFDLITANFLKVLVQNRRLYALQNMIKVFQDMLNKKRGRVIAQIKVAQDLTDSQRKKLQETLSKSLNMDVDLDLTVRPELIGGMVVTIGSTMIDDSVQRKLELMKLAMKRSANENAPKEQKAS